MTRLDAEIAVMTEFLRRQGAMMEIDPGAPPEVKRAWLRMIADCPECQAEMRKRNN